MVFAVLIACPAYGSDGVVLEFESPTERLGLSAADVARAAPFSGDEGPGLRFELSGEAARAFADLTERTVGQTLTLSICGDMLINVVIQARIEGLGQVSLDSLDSANFYARVLNGEISC